MAEHVIVKPEKIAATAAVALEQSLVVPALFQREGIDAYKGAENDTINVKVEGVLPFRTYGWRNDRSAPIQFDDYAEKTVAVSFGGNTYSAVKLTDEQRDMDLGGWTKLMAKQTEAIGRGLERGAVDKLLAQTYAVTLGGAVDRDAVTAGVQPSLRGTLIRAREVLNRFMVPQEGRVLLVGSGWESALLSDDKLNLAGNVGEQEAVSALREASIGRRFGFDIVVSLEVPADAAFALHRSAFIFATGAPSVPSSVTGGTAAHNGVALRWLQDYDANYLTDRSVVNTYRGFREVKDQLIGINAGQAFVSTHEHFVRAIKLDLDQATDTLPVGAAAGDPADELARITGIGTPFGG